MTTPFIPLALPDLRGNEETYVLEALRSTWISSTGHFIDRFEKEFSALCGVDFTLGVCNGTIALHLALLGLDVRPGDEVLVPSLTYVATANAVKYVGAEPVFVDIDPNNWCIDPTRLEAHVTPRTRGIIPVHLYGHPADMDKINQFAAIHGLWVVEDAAEAHRALYKGRPCGSLARVATFSFFGNKILTSGEGGAVTHSDSQLEIRLRALRGQGMSPVERYYFPITGYNFRLNNIACALLCAQIERVEEILAARHRVFAAYRTQLASVEGIGFQPISPWADPAPWVFCITVDAKIYGHSRDALMKHLEEHGIESRPFFHPLHHQPPFRQGARQRNAHLPVTDSVAASGINLPCYTRLTETDITRIAETIRSYKGKNR